MFKSIELTGGVTYNFSMYAKQSGNTDAQIDAAFGSTGTAAGMTSTVVAATEIGDAWVELTGTITPATTGTYYLGIKGAVGSGSYRLCVDDIKVTVAPPMSYTSSDVIQAGTGVVQRGNSKVKVLQIPVVTSGQNSPLQATRFTINANGSSQISKISNARLYYTGTSSTFATDTQFGSTYAVPTVADFNISGSQNLAEGTNYFWLTFDIAGDALEGSTLDAECKVITISTANKIPTTTAPAGNITITAYNCGTRTICATGNYTSIASALTGLATPGLGGPVVLELQADYTPGTAKISFNALTGLSSTNTLTIRPAADVSSPITLYVTADTVLAFGKGVNNVIIDGRPNSEGFNKMLIIDCASATKPAIGFLNDANHNIIRYCTILGRNTGTASGVVTFGTTARTNGNDNNTIEFCDISARLDAFSGTYQYPLNLIYSAGTAAKENGGNIIDNCNLFEFRGVSSAGLNLGANNTAWTITNNHIYQTTNYSGVAGTTYGIALNSGSGHLVSNNYIGGSGPYCSGQWLVDGTAAAFRFVGILANVGTTIASSIQGNFFDNFSWLSSSGLSTVPGVWSAIYCTAGNLDIGTVTGNSIGNNYNPYTTICITTTTNGGISTGIVNTSTGTVKIANNNFGGIYTFSDPATISHGFNAIWNSAGTVTIDNNQIGCELNTICAANASSNSTAQSINGILNSGTGTYSITNNTILNLDNYYAGSGSGQVRGIVSTGTNTITGNKISNLYNTAAGGTAAAASIIGISYAGIGASISNNTINTLSNSNTSALVTITGLYSAHTAGTVTVNANKIYDLSLASANNASSINGMQFAGTVTGLNVQNNMLTIGSSLTGNCEINGLNLSGGMPNVYFNSVLIDGIAADGTGSTHAIYESVTAAHTVKNNIFINRRTGGSGKHYALKTGSATVTGMDYNNNLYSVGSGAFLNAITTTEKTDLSSWKTAFGHDASSKSSAIIFVDELLPSGEIQYKREVANVAVFDTGTPISGITTDFYGTTRPQYNQPDIGAYELEQSSGLSEIVVPATATLSQNYPNPFNPATTISFSTEMSGSVKLTVLNAKGETVANLVNNSLAAGSHKVDFNGTAFNSGVYFYRLETPTATITKKMVLVK